MEFWGQDRVEWLLRLLKQGMSASEIARTMGISRNAVIGKTHRLKVAGAEFMLPRGRPTSAPSPLDKPKQRRPRARILVGKIAPMDQIAPPELIVEADGRPITIYELKPHHCKAVLCGLHNNLPIYCGEPRLTFDGAFVSPYCEAHHRAYHQPTTGGVIRAPSYRAR